MTSNVFTVNRIGLPERDPCPGELVQIRSRRWLVDETIPPENPGDSCRVRMSCADDDAQGQALEVFWELEPDRLILEGEAWEDLGKKGFDPPRHFSAFLHTLKWNCVTATDPGLFQAPFRAGIQIDAYQMEPLRKALLLPRVNLFIADDTGLGKTIEAGLIARELLLRKKAKNIVVSAPPSVLEQWRAELEERFGLVFEVLDREYMSRVRRDRGFGVNPWRTHSRFLISHRLLIDENYAGPMREWLGTFLPGSLLILDEAHHAAPASGNRYGIETKFTRAVRDLSTRFEHRLFLSATPHNGHSSSFSTLLEILDPHRFTRGVKVQGKKALEDVMVRRLKEDIRAIQGGFPLRKVVRVAIDGLPETTTELQLSQLLDQYRTLFEQSHQGSTKKARAAAGLLVVGLQQKLLSSNEAFARTLSVHRKTMERRWSQQDDSAAATAEQLSLESPILSAPDADDERASWGDEELQQQENDAVAQMTAALEASEVVDESTRQQQRDLLQKMHDIAEEARSEPDVKMHRLIDWVRQEMCPDRPQWGKRHRGAAPQWNDRRVIIFTENVVGTKTRLKEILIEAIRDTDQAEDRIAVIQGATSKDQRKEIQRQFNADPTKEPLRILIATDAAREGLNFQAHCADLFHFDLPWNPGRLEQRNGRIDRKLQPADEVRCHYFVLPQRVEDRVLEVLVEKTERIQRELGSLSKVIDHNIEKTLKKGGIRHADADEIAEEIRTSDLDEEMKRATQEELEAARDRQEDLAKQIKRCEDLLEKSRKWVQFQAAPFREAISCALEVIRAKPLEAGTDQDGEPMWSFPSLEQVAMADPSWISTLDTLRAPRRPQQKLADWRKEAPIRPVIFEDAGVLSDEKVHLHLEQRMAQRLLSRFRSQGFIHHDLSRACLAQTSDGVARVVLLGRLSLYGKGAERLHEEVIPVAARWIDPQKRDQELRAYASEAESNTMVLLDEALQQSAGKPVPETVQQTYLASAARDVAELLPQLEPRAEEIAQKALQKLQERGKREADELLKILEKQKSRVQQELDQYEQGGEQQRLSFEKESEEYRQLEANVRSWKRQLERFDKDLQEEPARIQGNYEVQAQRVEPVGLVYLWPGES